MKDIFRFNEGKVRLRLKEIGNMRGKKRFSELRVEHFISRKVYYSA
jgi:hypothetical protein